MIKQGTKVTWTYQAGGIEFEKTGKMLSFVEALVPAEKTLFDLGIEATSRQKKFSDTSSNDRYLIEVKVDGLVHYYAPMASVVDKQNPKAVKAWEKENPSSTSDEVATVTISVTKSKVRKVPAPDMNEVIQMGNSTTYRAFAFNGKGGFVGYRTMGSRLKFLVYGDDASKFEGSYKSHVRNANSCYVYPMVDDEVVGNLTSAEAISFASAIEKEVKKMGYKTISVDIMIADLQEYAKGDTRRTIKVKFGS